MTRNCMEQYKTQSMNGGFIVFFNLRDEKCLALVFRPSCGPTGFHIDWYILYIAPAKEI